MKRLIPIIALALFACASDTKVPDEDSLQPQAREIVDEVSVGREMAAKLIGTFNLYQKEKAGKYVSLVGHSLVQSIGRPEITFHFAMLDTDESNAFATPGGYIFVTKGLLKMISNENELAAVLAHEIAHVNEKHMYKEIMPKKTVSAGETLSRVLSRGRADIGASLSQIVSAGMKKILEDGLEADKEYEADSASAMYLSLVGYNSEAMVSVIEKIDKEKKSFTHSKTHPAAQSRIAKLKQFCQQNGLNKKEPGRKDILDKRFELALNGL